MHNQIKKLLVYLIRAGIQIRTDNRINTFYQSGTLNDFIQPGINLLLNSYVLVLRLLLLQALGYVQLAMSK